MAAIDRDKAKMPSLWLPPLGYRALRNSLPQDFALYRNGPLSVRFCPLPESTPLHLLRHDLRGPRASCARVQQRLEIVRFLNQFAVD